MFVNRGRSDKPQTIGNTQDHGVLYNRRLNIDNFGARKVHLPNAVISIAMLAFWTIIRPKTSFSVGFEGGMSHDRSRGILPLCIRYISYQYRAQNRVHSDAANPTAYTNLYNRYPRLVVVSLSGVLKLGCSTTCIPEIARCNSGA